MAEATNFRSMAIRVRLYSSIVIVCLSMLVMGALPKLLPGGLPGGPDAVTQWVEVFKLPLWFMTVTGVIELGAGLLVLHYQTRVLGGLLAAATMLGAAGVNLINFQTQGFVPLVINAFILVAALLVIGSRKDQILVLLGRA